MLLRIIIASALISTSAPAQEPDESIRLEFSPLSDTIPVNDITRAKLDSVYTLLAGTRDIIEFEDCNICKSRAHVTARIIEKNFTGVTIGKAWLFADSKRKSKAAYYKYKPEVYLENLGGENTGSCKSWGYHVAPVIITEADTFVIDPATQTNPAKIQDWALKLIPSSGKGFLVIKDKKYFIYPDDKQNLFEDEKQNWTDENKPITDDAYLKSIDEITRATLGFVEPWRFRYFMKRLTEMVE